jgi:DNA invertase Pin-like site-specific DNA recombinase
MTKVTQPPPPDRAALYVRVSTGRQGEHGLSLKAQLDAWRAEAERHGWEIVA